MARVLIVEDEPDLRGVLEACFADSGFSVVAVGSVKDARRCLDSEPVNAAIVDLGLPDGSGLDLIRAVRERRPPIGILIVTGKGDPVDRILGLELGADDYVTKPFVGRELVARVRSVLRRLKSDDGASAVPAQSGPVTLTVGTAQINVPGRIVSLKSGGTTVLSAVEMAILLRLHQDEGRAVSRDDLSAAALGRPWEPDDRTIDQNVSSLRRKLGLPAGDQGPILTVRGVGYLLTGGAA
jgi:DNA-binding response OmpR family regulator